MYRLIEEIVRSGFVIACRLASCPTRRSPVFVNATTEGVVRDPSAFGITVGCVPSITATTELVVPRSIPTTFAIRKTTFPSPGPAVANERRSLGLAAYGLQGQQRFRL